MSFDGWKRLVCWKKWSFLDWVIFIVFLLKFDGSVCVCGDYKVMIDFVLEVLEYLMFIDDDIYYLVIGGEKVIKLDLFLVY